MILILILKTKTDFDLDSQTQTDKQALHKGIMPTIGLQGEQLRDNKVVLIVIVAL